jgi:hypothetical protein
MLGPMETVLGLLAFPLLLAIPIAYLLLQVRLVRHWAGGWRIAAALPTIGWLVWLAGFVRDIAVDPTSHNLFPFEILIGAAAALLYLAILATVRRAAELVGVGLRRP